MITGQFESGIFAQEQWNNKLISYLEKRFGSESLINRFVDTLSNGSPINSLKLDKVYVITSSESASASELLINGLSLFLSKPKKLNVKVVNKDVVLFKAIDAEKNYSESAIVTRKSGELIHEITKNIKSENSEKYIFFYSCKKREKKV